MKLEELIPSCNECHFSDHCDAEADPSLPCPVEIPQAAPFYGLDGVRVRDVRGRMYDVFLDLRNHVTPEEVITAAIYNALLRVDLRERQITELASRLTELKAGIVNGLSKDELLEI